jgi:hypothetical protein
VRNSIAIVVTVALSGLPLAQSRPNFSGTWTEAGVGAGQTPKTLIVQQDAATLTIQAPPFADRWVFKLDGSESRNSTRQTDGRLTETISTAKWDGDQLVIATPGRSNGDGPYVATSTWTLSEGKLVEKQTIVTKAGSILTDYTRTYSR